MYEVVRGFTPGGMKEVVAYLWIADRGNTCLYVSHISR